MHKAAGEGAAVEMGLAAAASIPAFAYMRAVAPSLLTKAGDVARKVPDAAKTGLAYMGSASADAAADQLYGN
jgi:nucleoside 2-deoxyribosyltransferase